MKQKITQTLEIPEGIACSYSEGLFKCKKGSLELERLVSAPEIEIKIHENKVSIECKKGNKNTYKKIMTIKAHVNNIFRGLQEPFVYELESANVHFPMTIKSEGSTLTVGNFLGEKTPRIAKILPNVDVEIKGQKITVKSPNREAAGQTAANFEKATKLKGRDRRIFQDGIFITVKPRRNL